MRTGWAGVPMTTLFSSTTEWFPVTL
jgi:hypothetical protein